MAERERIRIGVLISGSGTNLQAIIDACRAGHIDGDVVAVVSNHHDAYGLERARKAGIDAVFIDRAEHGRTRDYDRAILRALQDHEVDLVVMAGYMRLLGAEVLDAYPTAVMNIHPAILPAFAGASGIRDAFEYGAKVSGVTVHFADEAFDEGPVILQEAVPIEEDDTLESLAARIHDVEHRLYPAAIQLWAEGRLSAKGRKVHILPA
jgi:phosphoribosylglycinamide formyltransferase-1